MFLRDNNKKRARQVCHHLWSGLLIAPGGDPCSG